MSTKVKNIRVKNLKAVSEQELKLNGCSALIVGRNRSGKSTILRALPDRFRGIKPELVVKHNESEGFEEFELTDGVKLLWQFDTRTKKGERLTIITHDADGKELIGAVTEEIMKRYFPEVFDVDAFLQSTPAKQRKELQRLSKLDLTAIDSRYKAAYEDRTYKNSKVTEAEALLKPINRTLATLEEPTEEIQKELNLIDSHNEKYNNIKKGVAEKETKLPKTTLEIKRLTQLLKSAQDEEKQLTKEIKDGKAWLEVPKNQVKDEKYHFDLSTKLQKAVDDNKIIAQNNKHIQAEEDLKLLKDTAKAADNNVKAILKEKDQLIATAKLPEGFGFSDEGITYNGMAFSKDVLASSEIYIAALKLASIDLGEVKMLHFDASFLDKNSLAEVETWANVNDLQLLIERPDFEGGEITYNLINEVTE